jgi:hypothetical protein
MSSPKLLEGVIGFSWLFVQDTVGSVYNPRPVLQPIPQLTEMGYCPSRCIYSYSSSSLFDMSLHDVVKVVSWAPYSREQHNLGFGLTHLVSLASSEHSNSLYLRTSDPYLTSMAAKKFS